MRYDIELDDEPARVLEGLPIDAVIAIHKELDRLSEAPLACGRKAHFPYRPAGMIYDFWCEAPDARYFITVFYHFLPGEQVIRVYALVARKYAPRGPDDGED